MNVFFALIGSKHFCSYFVWIYSDDVMTSYQYKRVQILPGGKSGMPEPMLINLVTDYDNSLTCTSLNLSRYEMKL